MVQKIRFMNHVIRLFGMTPTTSRAIPESCPSCGYFYNDGSHRKCYYLCCEYIDCLDCVLNHNKFSCPVFDDDLTAHMRRLKRKRARQEGLSSSSSSQVTTGSMIRAAERVTTAKTITTEYCNFFNESEDETTTVNVSSDIRNDCNVNVGTEELMDDSNKKTDTDVIYDEMDRLRATETEKINDCDVITAFKSKVELLLPKEHWNAVVVLERANGVDNKEVRKKRRKKYGKRFDPTLPPSRMSGRIRSAQKCEAEVVMPA